MEAANDRERSTRGTVGAATVRERCVGITVVILTMAIAHSKVTAQGQISVPADVRRKLGIGPGSVLEWEQDGDRIVVRRAGRFSSEEIHQALFGASNPTPRTVDELREGIRNYARKRYARS